MENRAFPNLILNPDAFFSGLSVGDRSLVLPAIIVGIIGLANIISSVLTGTLGYNPSLKAMFFSESPLLVLLIPFLLWIIAAGILFLIGRKISGKGDFIITVRNAGYGLFPMTVFGILFHVVMLMVMPGLVSHFAEGMLFMFVLLITFIACLFWTGYLLVFAEKHAHSLETGQASMAVILMSVFLVLCIAGIEFALLEYHGLTTTGMP